MRRCRGGCRSRVLAGCRIRSGLVGAARERGGEGPNDHEGGENMKRRTSIEESHEGLRVRAKIYGFDGA